MGLNSLQVCKDSCDSWLQGSFHKESSLDSSSSPSGDHMLTRPLMERRLIRTQLDQALNCPRCDSTHTKFCYYNNYSLSQPRYFCKTCRRYWTKGGNLRNIPVGGGCRKNKKISSKKSNNDHQPINQNHHQGLLSSASHYPTDLQLSFPHDVQYSHFNNLIGNVPHGTLGMLENPLRPIDFMESKLEAMVGNPRNYEFIGSNGELGMVDGLSNIGCAHGLDPSYHCHCSTYNGMSLEGNSGTFMNNTSQRLMLPYEANMDQNAIDVKPNPKLLSLEWKNQDCCDYGKDSFGYHNGLG